MRLLGSDCIVLNYDDIKQLSKDLKRPASTLIVLAPANDPFYCAPARQEIGKWFAHLWRHRFGAQYGHHDRAYLYKIVSQPEDQQIRWPDSTQFKNIEPHWQRLIVAIRDARYLGLVPADAISDRRNDEPLILLDEGWDTGCEIAATNMTPTATGLFMPAPPTLNLDFTAPRIAQRYQVCLWCEKTTMNNILHRLARRYHLNVVTGSGEISLKACVDVVERALRSGRPVRILYISDFDPGGQSMPVAAARKIEWRLYNRGIKDLINLQLRPVALDYDQCNHYELPRTPLKETERRAANFEQRFGQGATELDALEALHPGELERLLEREILRYYDPMLDLQVADIASDAELELQGSIDRINRQAIGRHRSELDRLRRQWADIDKRIKRWQRNAKPIWRAIAKDLAANSPDVPDIEWPEPKDGDEDDSPLFDSTRDYLDQIEHYKKFQGRPTSRRRRNGNGGGDT